MAGFSFDDVMAMAARALGSRSPAPAAKSSMSADDVMDMASRPLGSGGDVKQIVSTAARKYGVPEDLALRITGAESSGRANAQNKSSSAGGLYQIIDDTWSRMGGKPGKKYDPTENADVGSRFTRQNIDTLHNRLGRDITYGEAYAAHMFGDGVSSMLARAPKSAPIERGLSTFNDRGQVQRIMRANPNLRGKTVGQVMQDLETKVGRGVIPRATKVSDASDEIPQTQQLAQADDDSYESSWLEDEQQVA